MNSYPEAVDDAGSVSNLECICREHACLGRSNTKEIHLLVRKFRAEAKKLAKVMGNGALVEKFMGCFTPTFGDVIDEWLIVKYGHYKDPTRNALSATQFYCGLFLVVCLLIIQVSVNAMNSFDIYSLPLSSCKALILAFRAFSA